VDALFGNNPDRVDPFLFYAMARLKNQNDMASVKEEILSALNGFKDTLVEEERLQKVKQHVRYQVALSMDSSQAIARRLAGYIALRRTPETMNRVYALYEQVTPEDIRSVARKYLVEKARTIVTLTGGPQ
jgi:zinc protease